MRSRSYRKESLRRFGLERFGRFLELSNSLTKAGVSLQELDAYSLHYLNHVFCLLRYLSINEQVKKYTFPIELLLCLLVSLRSDFPGPLIVRYVYEWRFSGTFHALEIKFMAKKFENALFLNP